MAAPALFFTEDSELQLDDLLYEICDELQLPSSKYQLAEERYKSLSGVLESNSSPFRFHRPLIYAQGSMQLGTTVKPLRGPFDLDFVLQLTRSYREIEPMTLLLALFNYLKQHGVYGAMVSLKNRCVRIDYANDFYMDVLPACLNLQAGPHCLKVPDRELQGWKDSNPVGYAEWFKERSRLGILKLHMVDRALPVPAQETVDKKRPLQLVVQLFKRWRDVFYQTRQDMAPISIILTTLAAKHYDGNEKIGISFANIIRGITSEIAACDALGIRLRVNNPKNEREDLSERWSQDAQAYRAFVQGIEALQRRWQAVLTKAVSVNAELERLFGEPVQAAVLKQAKRIQEARTRRSIAVRPTGIITSAAVAGAIAMRKNTYHGQE